MKRKMLLLSLVLCTIALGFTSCSDDDDNVKQKDVPAAVKETFSNMYPAAAPVWEMEYGMYEAKWKEEGIQLKAWFQPTGEWKATETDLYNNYTLPEPVMAYINANYADYHIDDVDYMETPSGNYYEIDLERKGYPDVELLIRADGVLITNGFEPWANTDGDVAWKNVPAAVQSTFKAMFPGINAEWEIERGLYKAEWEEKGFDKEAWFEKDGVWVRTKSELNITTLPANIKNYVTNNHPGYYIDDADYIDTPTGSFYLIEIDKAGSYDIHLKFDSEGNIMP